MTPKELLRKSRRRWIDAIASVLPPEEHGAWNTPDEAAAAIRAVLEQRDEARAAARVLAHAYANDNRPPNAVVWRALDYPAVPLRGRSLRDKVLEALRFFVKQTGHYKHVMPYAVARRIDAPKHLVRRELLALSQEGLVEWRRSNGSFVYRDPSKEPT